MFENENHSSVLGNKRAPYFNKLAEQGANMTRSYGVTHPSQPNYLALFSGSTHGVTSNVCRHGFNKADNLGHQLQRAGLSFTGYAESLPKTGFTGCVDGRCQRKHNSWVDFDNLPKHANRPFRAFPHDYQRLPTVSFVSPNMCHSMHDCSIRTGDRWLRKHFDHYLQWAQRHNSWLVVTFDENAGGTVRPVPTILVGAGIRPGRYTEPMNHYTLLRTIEDAYGLPALGRAAVLRPLATIWTDSPAPAPDRGGLVNGSFEFGLAGWATSGSVTVNRAARYRGTLGARTGKRKATAGNSMLSQKFVVPADAHRLTVWWLGRCADRRSKAWAAITIERKAPQKRTMIVKRTCVARGGWRRASVAVMPGARYTLKLISHDDGRPSTPNRTYFDDVTLS